MPKVMCDAIFQGPPVEAKARMLFYPVNSDVSRVDVTDTAFEEPQAVVLQRHAALLSLSWDFAFEKILSAKPDS